MDREKRHKRVVRQRILAFIFTILVLGGLTFGAVWGILYLKKTGFLDRLPKPQPKVEGTTTEAPSEEDDSWIAVEKEVIEDDYADVDTSVLSENETPTEEPEPEPEYDEEIEAIIADLALEEKVAQLFIATPEQVIDGSLTVTQAGEKSKEALSLYPVGGLVYFAQNLEEPEQTKEMLSNTREYIKDACGIEPFLAVDEEGGRVVRVADNEAFEIDNVGPMAEIGRESEMKAADKAYSAGETIGGYLSDLGFNLDFAPCADVVPDNENEAIGDRSFGSDPEKVAKLTFQYAFGLQEKGVTACYKHFPGHGSVEGDSHETAVSQNKTKEELFDSDLIPFRSAVENGARMIMAGHISCPGITGDDTPASLSSVMITDILREEMGYKGIIITDSFQMGAVTSKYPNPGDAAINAIKAGADIVLMPGDFHEAYNAVLSAVSAGDIEEGRVDESLRRILTVKLGKEKNEEE
ncbi:MAG: hypothetical protein IJT24_07340 [Lachnospiraceae bacterium]|nr:hypothetical protein [Lachnospiraceae bacterium]